MDVQNVFGQVADAPDALMWCGTRTGTPIPDPMNSARYQARYIGINAGSAIPAIGLIVEL